MMFGATSMSAGVPPGARSYCPSTLLAMNASSAPASAPVTLLPNAWTVAFGVSPPRFSTIASKVGSSIALIESALTPIHVARSTTSASGASSGVASRAVSATGVRAAARQPGSRRPPPRPRARVTPGPAGTSVRPVVFANSQSTYATQRLPLLVAAGQRQPHLVSAATIRSNAARARCVPP